MTTPAEPEATAERVALPRVRWTPRRLIRQRAVWIGLIFIALLWGGLALEVRHERVSATENAFHDADVATRILEEHAVRVIHEVDQTMLYLRDAYARNPTAFDLARWVSEASFLDDVALQLSLADATGDIVDSSLGKPVEPISIADREHFKFQLDPSRDELFISKPLVGRVSMRRSVQLTRKIVDRAGTFVGVVVVSINPNYLSSFYDSVDLGPDGMITLTGLDGIVRARAAGGNHEIGQSIASTPFLSAVARNPAGNFTSTSPIDNVRRFGSYRKVRDLPLVVTAGLSQEEVLKPAREMLRLHGLIAALLTLAIGGAVTAALYYGPRLRTTEAALHARSEQYRRVVEGAHEIIFETDLVGRWTFLNPAWTRITGLSVVETLGHPFWEYTHPEAIEFGKELFRTLIAGERDRCDLDVRIRAADGSYRRYDAHVTAIRDQHGDTIGTSGTLADITEFRATAESLRALAERQAALLDALPAQVALVDRDGVILAINRLWRDAGGRNPLVGYGAEPGKNYVDVLAASSDVTADAPQLGERLRGVLGGKAGDCTQDYTVGSAAALRWYRFMVASLPGLNGAVIMHLDVTAPKAGEAELKRAKAAAEIAGRAKAIFLATMTHEIRTPLNAVIGISGLLLDSKLDEEQRRLTSMLQSSGTHLLDLVNDILEFSKLDADKVELEHDSFDPEQLVRGVTEMLAIRARAKGLEIASFVAPDVPARAIGDAGRLRQVLINLAGNAVKFTERGGVAIELTRAVADSPAGDGVSLSFAVRDTGVGISEEARSRLFQEFTQADGSISRRFGGTGLGLAISSRLVSLMGGRIEVESTPGKGSVFHFTIPVAIGEDRRGRTGSLTGRNILVVSDNPITAPILHRQLNAEGARCAIAGSGPAALARLRASATPPAAPIEAVIVDQQVADMTSGEIAAAIRAETGLAGLRLVLVTSASRTDASSSGDVQPYDARLRKPIALGELIAAIDGGAAEDRPHAAAAKPVTTAPQAPRRILMAEDNATNQHVLAAMIRKLGHVVEIVANGRDAVEAVAHRPYDLVLMDVMMPEMDGLSATRAIRAAEGPEAAVPIVVLTAGVSQQRAEECRAAGADDFATKPITGARLAQLIEHYARRAPRGAAETAAMRLPAVPADGEFDPSALATMAEDVGADALADVVRVFLADAEGRLAALQAMVAGGDRESLVREAHSLKSAAATLGLKHLSELAKELEGAASSWPDGRASTQVQAMTGQLDRHRSRILAIADAGSSDAA